MAKKANLSPTCMKSMAQYEDAIEASMATVRDPDEVNRITQAIMESYASRKVAPTDVMVSGIINSMLSGTGTAVANAVGLVFKAATEPLIGAVARTLEGKPVRALNEMVSGYSAMLRSFQMAASMGKEGYIKAYPLDFNAAMADLARSGAIKSEDFRKVLREELTDYRASLIASSTGKPFKQAREELVNTGYLSSKTEQEAEFQVYLNESYDYMKNVFVGKLYKFRHVNIPTKITVAIDEFGKSLFRQYRIGQMASEQAAKDVKQFGGDLGEATERYIKQVNEGFIKGDATTTLRNLQKEVGRAFGEGEADALPYMTIKDYAQRQMFQQRLTGLPADVHRLVQGNPAMRLFVPFMKTPWNITKEGFSYLPGAGLLIKNGYPLAAKAISKLTGKEHLDTVKRLGAYYELSNSELLARNVVGAAYFAGLYTLLQNGDVTGKPRDYIEAQEWKDLNKKEQSIKIGDEWYDYSRVEPVATAVGLMAELNRAYQEYVDPPAGKEPNDEAMKGIMYALKANVMQKSFVDGFNQLINGLMTPNKTMETISLAAAKPFTPALLAQAARILDPHERQATTFTEKMSQRIPGLREQLPIDYGLYGGGREGGGDIPVPFTDGVTTNLKELTSFGVSDATQTPLQRAFEESGLTAIRSNKNFKGVGLNNEQLAEYRKRVNDAVTKFLTPLASQESFQRLPPGTKRRVLKARLRQIKKPVVARYAAYLRKNYPDVARKLLEVELYKAGVED